jgi:hypothetical protein
MRRQVRMAVVVAIVGGLAVVGWIAAQCRWTPSARAERTALAYAVAVYRQDTLTLQRLAASGSAHNSLCAGRWSVSPAWGANTHPRVLRGVGWRDTVEYHIGPGNGPTVAPLTFIFLISLQQPEKVLSYHVPPLPDSATAPVYFACIGWPDWPRVRPVERALRSQRRNRDGRGDPLYFTDSFSLDRMHRSLLFSALAVLTACSDRLTAPEAEALLSAIDQPLGRGELGRLFNRSGFGEELTRLRAGSRVIISQDGQSIRYSAVVFERLMVPRSGSGRSTCLGPRWSLFLWREDPMPEGLLLRAGRFDQRFSPGKICEDVDFSDPSPELLRYPPGRAGEQQPWVSRSGRGEITPGLDAGPCEFFASGEAEVLRSRWGISCRRTRHRVHFQSTLQPIGGSGSAGAPVLETMRVLLRPAEVMGIRYTIDCLLPQAADMCRARGSLLAP